MTTPNIFKFATSELSQDAVFAYFLQWADPEFKPANAKMHALGTDFLRSVLDSINHKTSGKITIPEFKKVRVQTQESRIDVAVEINDKIFLIIEDKTNTGRHSKQIKRYKAAATKKLKNSNNNYNEPWKIVAVYLKTGNDLRDTVANINKSADIDGVMYRPDVLKVLQKYTDTGNDIANEFRQHLENMEKYTYAWKTCGRELPWKGIEGYYVKLSHQLPENSTCQFVNPKGYKHQLAIDNSNSMYLQIEHGVNLFIRARRKGRKFTSPELLKYLQCAKQCAEKFSGIQVEKPKHLRTGNTARFATVCFDNTGSYLAINKAGNIDLNATVKRLIEVNALVTKCIAKSAGGV